MEKRPTAKEMQMITQAAHIVASDFTEERLEKLFASEEYVAQPGFMETLWALIKLQQEEGITLERALHYYEELVAKVQQLEKAVASLKQEHEAWQRQLQADMGAVAKAEQQRQNAERGLAAFNKQVDTEKNRLAAELATARKEAEVSLKEVAEVARLKAELKARGLTVKFLLDLCLGLELAPESAERIGRDIEMNGTLAQANVSSKKELETNQALIAKSKEELTLMQKLHREEEQYLSKLREDRGKEDTVHRFHRRFSGLEALMQYVAGWDQLAFVQCRHWACGARFWVDRGPSGLHLRSQLTCPCCGGKDLEPDAQAYGVGYAGTEFFVKLRLGE